MRKNSQQLYKEILLEREIDKFVFKERLRQCMDDMLNFKTNELEALVTACELTKDNPILQEYVNNKIIEHARNLMSVLGVTIEGFKELTEGLEQKHDSYQKIRNEAKQRFHSESKIIH